MGALHGKIMGALGEIIRGVSASASWLLGLPFVNLRIVLTAKDHHGARQLMAAHLNRRSAVADISRMPCANAATQQRRVCASA